MMYCPYCNIEYADEESCFCFPHVEVFTPMFAAHPEAVPAGHVHSVFAHAVVNSHVVRSKDPLPERLAFLATA